MKKIILLAFLLYLPINSFAFSDPNQMIQVKPYGGPLFIKGFQSEWDIPILIYSDSDRKAYMTAGSIEFAFAGTTYLQNGSFLVRVCIWYTGDKVRQRIIEDMKRWIKNQSDPEKYLNPKFFTYECCDIGFDKKENKVFLNRQFALDRDGEMISAYLAERVIEDPNSFFKKLPKYIDAALSWAKEHPPNSQVRRFIESRSREH